MTRAGFSLSLLTILAACGSGTGSAPGAVSEGEARALEEAADMLDERRLPEGALPAIDAPAIDAPEQGANEDLRGDTPE